MKGKIKLKERSMEKLLRLSEMIKKNKHKNQIVDYINDVILTQKADYLIDILEEIKCNIINNKIEYAYVGLIEVIDYLDIDLEMYNIHKNYLDYIWEG